MIYRLNMVMFQVRKLLDNQRVTIVTIIDSIPLNLIKSDLIPVKS